MKTHNELKLYKDYLDYFKQVECFEKINIENYVLEEYRELDDEGGLYIRLNVKNNIYEIWLETLIDFRLWINFFEKKIN